MEATDASNVIADPLNVAAPQYTGATYNVDIDASPIHQPPVLQDIAAPHNVDVNTTPRQCSFTPAAAHHVVSWKILFLIR